MTMTTQDHDPRAEQAVREAGHTEVKPGLARFLTAAFLALLASVMALEIRRELDRPNSPWRELAAAPGNGWRALAQSGPIAANRQVLAAITGFEDALKERSVVTERVGRDIQFILTRWLNSGTDQVVKGRRGWLYFRPALDYVTGSGFLEPKALARQSAGGPTFEARPQPDPLIAISDFAAQLAERGIGLVVVPIPVKVALHPEGLASGLDDDLPLANPSFGRFIERLAAMGVPVYSPGPRLAQARREKPWTQYLRTDTHWTPQAMEFVAEGLATLLNRSVPLPESRRAVCTRREAWVRGRGDLAALIKVPMRREIFSPELVRTQQVVGEDGQSWTADPAADVLLLGDSFANIYSQSALGFGESAGLAEQLAYYLGRPVDKLAINAGGPSAGRKQLAADLAGGTDRLAGKRLVIYQFSERELSSGDWPVVSLAAAPSPGLVQTTSARRPEQPLPARGFTVWESNRTGDWRIWTRRLEGSTARQLSTNEPERQHCCAHLSPDGSMVAYLSRSVPKDEYPELEVAGDLRVLRLAGSAERTVVTDARPYGWGNRAVVWRNNRELIYIGDEGRTFLLDITTGRKSPLSDEPRVKLAWLVDSTLRHAVNGSPTFSPYDAAGRRIHETERWPGCEPYFSHDGRFGFWVEQAGGPVRFVDLASGKKGTVLDHLDPRIQGDQRYAYFPMLSRDGRMLAFGASAGDHDHFRSNYDIFVAPLDPSSLQLLGRPRRMTSHPASDRYPDVHVESLDLERWRIEMPPVPLDASAPQAKAAGPIDARAELRACSRVPSLREISPYRDALIVCEWETAAPGSRLRVAHWGLRGGERQPAANLAPGFMSQLSLEPMVGASQTQGYPVFDTLPRAPDLPVYYAKQP
jgi:alginate O-acetyltransferase complex protein AlgJ